MTTTDFRREALAWFHYLSQGETWVPNGKPPLPIAEMDAAWRHNAANWLLKRAKTLATYYGLGEIEFIFGTTAPTVIADENGQPIDGPEVAVFAPRGDIACDMVDRELDEGQRVRDADPEGWLKTTALYQALVADLPADASEHAKHWSDCDSRTGQSAVCSCWQRHITECPVHSSRDISAPCHCRDNSPEWTDA